ncbi:MAG: hypothetical protein R3343_05845 [Nitriliruptorales bacterium]|nr:hypothetical protein [Nitriliruptorales bacterium]
MISHIERLADRHGGLLATVLGVAAAGSTSSGIVLASLNGNPIGDSSVGFSLPFVSFAVVGAVIVWKRPRNAVGWLLALGSLAILTYGASEEYARYGLITRPSALPGASIATWFRVALWVPAAAVTIVYLPLLFPSGRLPSDRWRFVAWGAGAATVVLVAVQWIAAWPHQGPVLLDPQEAWIEHAPLASAIEYVFSLLLLSGIASIASLFVRFRRAARAEQLQIKWVLFSLGSFLAALIGDMLAPFETGPWPFAAVILVAISFLVSILRFRLYEIDRLVSRTVTYVMVVTALVGVYAVSVLGLGAAARVISGESSDLVVALSTLLVAALFQPVRRRVQAAVERRFNRRRYDAQQTLDSFGRSLRDELDSSALVASLRDATATTLHPSLVSVHLVRGDAT